MTHKKAKKLEPESKPKSKGKRWILRCIFIISSICIMIILCINLFFIDSILQSTFSKIKDKTGIFIQYKKAESNLFTGTIRFSDVSLKRKNHKTLDFDLGSVIN